MKNSFWRDERYPYLEIRKTEDSRGEYKPHSHDSYLSVGAVDSGDIVMHCSGEDFTIGSGTIVIFNPNEMHSCNPIAGRSRTYSMMHLATDWCADIQREIFGTDGYMHLKSGAVTDTELYEEYNWVCDAFLNDEPDAEEALIRFIAVVFEKYCEKVPAEDVSSMVLSEISAYICEHPFENISLEELAEKFRQNRFHLLRCFRKEYGLPPHAYQMNIRIDSAKRMLREGMSIADVAQTTGFTDQSHFHRIFKKYTSATPGEYRQ